MPPVERLVTSASTRHTIMLRSAAQQVSCHDWFRGSWSGTAVRAVHAVAMRRTPCRVTVHTRVHPARLNTICPEMTKNAMLSVLQGLCVPSIKIRHCLIESDWRVVVFLY